MDENDKKQHYVSRETTKRLIYDVREIMNCPLTEHGIYYSHDEENMMKGYAMIVGQEGTPYFGGYYFFKIYFPSNYPYSPPLFMFCTNNENIRFNPNLYIDGKVCLSILNTWQGEQWSSCQTISSVLLSLCTIFHDIPLLNEPGVNKFHPDIPRYNDILEYKNIEIAILKIVKKNPCIYDNDFDVFYPIIIEQFTLNFSRIQSQLLGKVSKIKGRHCLEMQFYGMRIYVNYEYLLNELNSFQKIISSK